MLFQKDRNKAAQREWELEQMKAEIRKTEEAEAAKAREIEAFKKQELSIIAPSSTASSTSGSGGQHDATMANAAAQGYREVKTADGKTVLIQDKEFLREQMNNTRNDLTEEERKARTRAVPFFWAPVVRTVHDTGSSTSSSTSSSSSGADAKEQGAEGSKKPSDFTACPEGNHVLKLKMLREVKFTIAAGKDEGSSSKSSSKSEPNYMCPACRKGLTRGLKAVCLKACGHVVCGKCCDTFVKKDHACPDCSTSCDPKKEIIPFCS